MLYSGNPSKFKLEQPHSYVFERTPLTGSGSTGNPSIRFDFNFKNSLNTKRNASEVEYVLKSGLMTEYQKDGDFRKKYFPTTYYGEVVITLDLVRLERCRNCCYVAVDPVHCAEVHRDGVDPDSASDIPSDESIEDANPQGRMERTSSQQNVTHDHSARPPKRLKEDYYFYMTIALELNGTTTQTSKCYARLEFASQIRNHRTDEPDCYKLKIFSKNGKTALSSQGIISCVTLGDSGSCILICMCFVQDLICFALEHPTRR